MERAAVEVPQPSGSRDEAVALVPEAVTVALVPEAVAVALAHQAVAVALAPEAVAGISVKMGRKRANRIVDEQALSRKKFKHLKQPDM